jgi:formylglycine-generating enzyme required for sulfatase activity
MRASSRTRAVRLLVVLAGVACGIAQVKGGQAEDTAGEEAPTTKSGAVTKVDPPRGEEILGPGLGEFIFIAGGEFTMGRNDGEHEDQRPEHVVELSSFHVGRTPVTVAQFVQFLNEANVKQSEYLYSQIDWGVPSVTFSDGKWIAAPSTENDAATVGGWELGQKYCEWLSAKSGRKCRLPTEAEWEYVCRGKKGRKFPWGNAESHMATRVWDWRGFLRKQPIKIPVGSLPEGATPEGVCDLIGYMDEMCSDWYAPDYYAESDRKNPQGPSEMPQRAAKVSRGGVEHRYSAAGVAGFFRYARLYGGVLPSTFLPRGWSRNQCSLRPKTVRNVNGRLGLRVVVELAEGETAEDQASSP